MEKASHRGHRGHKGGIGVGGQNCIGVDRGAWARSGRKWGKHRTEVQRSQKGGLGWWPKLYRCRWWRPGEKWAQMGKASHRGHRGGDWVGGQNCIVVDGGAWARSRRKWESIAQRSRGHRGGIGVGGQNCIVVDGGARARSGRNGESIAQRSRGGIGLVAKIVSV